MFDKTLGYVFTVIVITANCDTAKRANNSYLTMTYPEKLELLKAMSL